MATIGPKLYCHDAATTNTGTLPGASSQSATSPSVTATGATTNRTLSDVIGASQTSSSVTTLAQTTMQTNWHRRFMTPPLAAQTISATAWGGGGAGLQSNTNSSPAFRYGVIYTWRPGTGARVTLMWDGPGSASGVIAGSGAGAASTETWVTSGSATLTNSSTIQDGDVLVVEVWTWNNQAMATAYTNQWFYDGTTEGSSTSAASYITVNNGVALTLQAAAATPKPLGLLGVG